MVGPVAEGRGQRHRSRAADRALRAALHAAGCDPPHDGRRVAVRTDVAGRTPAARHRWRSPTRTPTRRPPTDGDVLEVRGDVGWTAWISCAAHLPWGQPDDQRPDEAYSLTYTWPELEHELEILGHARLTIVAHVVGADRVPLGEALRRLPRRRVVARQSQPAEPGAPERRRRTARRSSPANAYEITLDLEATSWTFEAGHRIRLDLAGTDWPNVWTPPEPVTLTIDRAATTLTLPVLDGPSPAEGAPTFAPPRRRGRAATPCRTAGTTGSTGASSTMSRPQETRAVVSQLRRLPGDGRCGVVRGTVRRGGHGPARRSRDRVRARCGDVRDAMAGGDLRRRASRSISRATATRTGCASTSASPKTGTSAGTGRGIGRSPATCSRRSAGRALDTRNPGALAGVTVLMGYPAYQSTSEASASGEAGQVLAEQDEPDARGRVEQEVRDHERPRPAQAEERDAEEDAHGQVAREPSPPLIQVVRGAQQRARRDGGERAPRQLPQPGDQVPEDDDLFEQRRLRRRSTAGPARSTSGRAAAPARRTGSRRARPLRSRTPDPPRPTTAKNAAPA